MSSCTTKGFSSSTGYVSLKLDTNIWRSTATMKCLDKLYNQIYDCGQLQHHLYQATLEKSLNLGHKMKAPNRMIRTFHLLHRTHSCTMIRHLLTLHRRLAFEVTWKELVIAWSIMGFCMCCRIHSITAFVGTWYWPKSTVDLVLSKLFLRIKFHLTVACLPSIYPFQQRFSNYLINSKD